METFSFSPPLNLIAERKWLLAVTSFGATNSVFIITNKNNSFSISIPGYWYQKSSEEFLNRIHKLLDLGSQNDIESHVEEVEKRCTRRKIEKSDYNLAIFHHFKSEILVELKRVKYKDLEDIVLRREFP